MKLSKILISKLLIHRLYCACEHVCQDEVYEHCMSVCMSCSSPERGSMGLRLFSGNRGQSLKREIKTTLSAIVKYLQEEIDNMSGGTEERDKEQMRLVQFLPATLRWYIHVHVLCCVVLCCVAYHQ